MPTIHSYAESTLQPNPILEVAVSLLSAVLCQQLHRLAGFEGSCRFWLWPFRKTWLLEPLPFCKLLWQNELGFFLLVRKCSAKSSLFGLAELKRISQNTCGFCSYPFARLSWLFWQLSFSGAQCQLCCTSCHPVPGVCHCWPSIRTRFKHK